MVYPLRRRDGTMTDNHLVCLEKRYNNISLFVYTTKFNSRRLGVISNPNKFFSPQLQFASMTSDSIYFLEIQRKMNFGCV